MTALIMRCGPGDGERHCQTPSVPVFPAVQGPRAGAFSSYMLSPSICPRASVARLLALCFIKLVHTGQANLSIGGMHPDGKLG